MRMNLAFGVLLAAVSMPALAANFSGKWALQSAAAGGGATVVTLNQAGNEVKGTISIPIEPWTNSPVNDEIWGGKVEGNTVSFYVWTGTDQPAKTIYRGTLSQSGDEIVFTVIRGGAAAGAAAGGQPAGATAMQMVARRVNSTGR